MKTIKEGQHVYNRGLGWGVIQDIDETGYYVHYHHEIVFHKHRKNERRTAIVMWLLATAALTALLTWI